MKRLPLLYYVPPWPTCNISLRFSRCFWGFVAFICGISCWFCGEERGWGNRCFVFVIFINYRRYHTAQSSDERPNFVMTLGILAKTLRIFYHSRKPPLRHCDIGSVMICGPLFSNPAWNHRGFSITHTNLLLFNDEKLLFLLGTKTKRCNCPECKVTLIVSASYFLVVTLLTQGFATFNLVVSSVIYHHLLTNGNDLAGF